MSIKKAKGVNENVEKITHSEHKSVLLNKKSSINKIENENHNIGTYEISKISLSCFDELVIRKQLWNSGQLFCQGIKCFI